MMKLQIRFLFLFLSAFYLNSYKAQNNLHYSQFYNAPLFLNPALTGQLGEDLFRLNAHARSQWSGLTDGGGSLYEMKSGGIDFSLFNKRLGVGLYGLLDDAGGGIYKSTQGYLSLSYSFIMGDNILTFGGQGMFNSSKLELGSARWQQMPQTFQANSSYADFNAGVNFKWDLYYLTSNTGISVSNLTRAVQRFGNGVDGVRVPMTFKGYTTIEFDMTDRLKLLPGVFGAMQASATDIVAGSNLSYKLIEGGTNGNRLILGVWVRSNNGNMESVIPKFGMRMNKLQVMASYDYNLSMSKGGSSNYFQGLTNTFEISIIFTGKPKIVPPLLEDDFILNPRY